jgi:transposase-like protein
MECKHAKLLKLDFKALREYAVSGATVERIARELNITRQTVRFNLRRIGVHREWTLKRFKKAQVHA